MTRSLLALGFAVALAAAGGGCAVRAYRGPVAHIHADGCGHFYWHGGWYAYGHPARCSVCYPGEAAVVTHTHGDGCGHWFWHGAWQEQAHPAGCTLCAAPPGTAVAIASDDPPPQRSILVTHSHFEGCGHWYYHDCWWDWPHPGYCGHCAGVVYVRPPSVYIRPPSIYIGPPRVSIGFGVRVGGGHRHGGRCR